MSDFQNLLGMNEMLGFESRRPEPQPIRHVRKFSKDELIQALTMYLEHNGVKVPVGETFVWGLEKSIRPETESTISLVIDEPQ